MAGFCTRCGRPLPEDGKCAFCPPADPGVGYVPQERRAPAPQENAESGFAQMLRGYLSFVKSFVKSPVDALRRVEEERDMAPAFCNAALLLTLTLLVSLLTALTLQPFYAKFAAGAWILETFLQPALGLGAGVGGLCLYRLVGKERVNLRAIVCTVGAAAILPVAALAVSLPLSIFGSTFYDVCWMLPLCAAAASMAFVNLRVSREKPTVWQLLVLCGVLLVSFLILNRLQNAFIACIYEY